MDVRKLGFNLALKDTLLLMLFTTVGLAAVTVVRPAPSGRSGGPPPGRKR